MCIYFSCCGSSTFRKQIVFSSDKYDLDLVESTSKNKKKRFMSSTHCHFHPLSRVPCSISPLVRGSLVHNLRWQCSSNTKKWTTHFWEVCPPIIGSLSPEIFSGLGRYCMERDLHRKSSSEDLDKNLKCDFFSILGH